MMSRRGAPLSLVRLTSHPHRCIAQRSGAAADLVIAGTYSGSISAIGAMEARWREGVWTSIDAAVAGGTLGGTLAACGEGQGILRIRSAADPNAEAAAQMGIGDLFAVAGQSNAQGAATNYQAYYHATLLASMYVSSVWSNLYQRSVWPGVATAHMAAQSVPCGFVMQAVSSTSIAQWQPAAAEGYYDALVAAINAAGGTVKACLWWQGENDVSAGTAEATYNAGLDTIADALFAATGAKMVVAKLQNWGDPTNLAAINSAITTAWGDNANVLAGPDLSGLTPSDGPHFATDAEMTTVSALWWAAIAAALFP